MISKENINFGVSHKEASRSKFCPFSGRLCLGNECMMFRPVRAVYLEEYKEVDKSFNDGLFVCGLAGD